MSDHSKIEWTDTTWNVVTGCTEVSPGCDRCYAKTFAERWRGVKGHHFENGFDLQLRPERLTRTLRWKNPRRIFVNSMSDLFHQDVPDEYIVKVWEVMAATPQHTYQILTKRHARMKSWFTRWPNAVLANVWLGVSVENQQWADIRIPALLKTPAAVRWISAEPLLGPIDLGMGDPHAEHDGYGINSPHPRICLSCSDPDAGTEVEYWRRDPDAPQLDWVVCGGESGHGARPMHPGWVRSLRDQCVDAGIPFLFKQWGEYIPESLGAHVITRRSAKTARYADFDGGNRPANIGARNGAVTCHRVGKGRAGRELDGRIWDEYPAVSRG